MTDRPDDALGYLGLSVPTFLPEILPAVEVGWRLRPDAWGQGLATEGAGAALDEAFTTLGLDEVCSVPQADNPASIRVAERLGMRLDRQVEIPANERRGAARGLPVPHRPGHVAHPTVTRPLAVTAATSGRRWPTSWR